MEWRIFPAPGIAELRAEVAALRAERAISPDDLLDTDQAAAYLGMTPHAIRQAAGRGAVPCRRVGRRIWFRRGDLQQLGATASSRAAASSR